MKWSLCISISKPQFKYLIISYIDIQYNLLKANRNGLLILFKFARWKNLFLSSERCLAVLKAWAPRERPKIKLEGVKEPLNDISKKW